MHATAMLVLVIAVVTVSACVQQSPPMGMSAANIVCQSNGERKNCVVSIVGMLNELNFYLAYKRNSKQSKTVIHPRKITS